MYPVKKKILQQIPLPASFLQGSRGGGCVWEITDRKGNPMREAEFKQYVYDHPEIYLDRDRSGKGFICPKCGGTMDFKGHDESGDFPFGEGYWVCSDCGFKITEDELWSSVRRE